MSCTLKMLIHNEVKCVADYSNEAVVCVRIKNKEEGKGALNTGILGDHRCPPCHE